MFIKNLISVIFGSVLFPILNIVSLIVPFLMTLTLLTAIGFIGLQVNADVIVKMDAGIKDMVLISLFFLAFLIAITPLLVAVMRKVVLGENIDFLVLKKLFSIRELSVVLVWVKFIVVFLIPIALAGLLISFTGDMLAVGVPDFGLDLGLSLDTLLLGFSFFMSLVLLARSSMAPVTGSIDKGISVRNSIRVTHCHTVGLLVIIVVLLALMGLLGMLVIRYLGISDTVMDPQLLLAMPIQGKLVLIAEVFGFRLLMAIIFMVAFSKAYLAYAINKD